MDNKTSGTTSSSAETNKTEVASTTVAIEEDAETKIARLEAEKAKIAKESQDWKNAVLKYKIDKRNSETTSGNDESDESDEDRLRRITREELANSRLADITREQDEIIRKALIENKELKTALKNKPSATPVSSGTESTMTSTTSGVLTKEQIDALKAKGWNDKDIERFKTNLRKNSR